MKKRDAYHPDYLKIYPCLKDRPDILKFLRQCDRKQEYLEYDLKVNRTRTNKRTMETVIWPQRELSYCQSGGVRQGPAALIPKKRFHSASSQCSPPVLLQDRVRTLRSDLQAKGMPRHRLLGMSDA